MLARSRFVLRTRALMLFGICLLALSALPAQTTMAAFKQNTIDNSVADFGRGQFQRAALGNLVDTASSPKLVDLPGAVRLGPIGILKTWTNSPFVLKKPLLRMGATAISNRVYVIGGTTPVQGGSAQQSVADVWSAAVNQSTGTFTEDWQAEPSLPAVVGSNQSDYGLAGPVAEINSPAVVSVSTGGSAGYIYVIGGNTAPSASSTVDFSSYAVRIGVVGANGHISSWVSGPAIPSPDGDTDTFGQLGLQSAMATTRVLGGSTYVYLIGGLRRYRTGSGFSIRTISEGQKTVFYAKVGSGGQLVKPSNGAQGWDRIDDVPLNDPSNGIWDGTVMADNFVASTGASHNALYVVGGQLTPSDPTAQPPTLPTFSSVAYRAFINDNGTLNWDGWTGTLQQTRNGLSGVTFRGTLYAVGGIPDGAINNDPDQAVLTTYVDDDLTLHQFDTLPPGTVGSGTNFLQSDALPVPRTFQASALVIADASSPNSAFIYVLGGRGKPDTDPGDDNGSDSVIIGKIGGSEDVSTTGYASTGWYYSQPFDINISGAQLQEISWAALIDRTAADPDILVDFRVTSTNSCATADWTDNSWVPLNGSTTDPHRSVNGQNSMPVTNLAARCFQYRAQLITNNYLVTPSLLNLSIKVFIPGGPDLSVQSIAARNSGKLFTGLNVVIQNLNQLAPPTLAADVDGGGSFFVDMCIFSAGTAATPPTLPLTPQNKQCSKAYSQIDKSAMGPNTTYSVTRWFDTATDQPVELTSYFQQPGSYTVIVAVDSFVDNASTSPKGYVDEGDLDKGESNNISAPYTFTVQSVGHGVYLAQMRR